MSQGNLSPPVLRFPMKSGPNFNLSFFSLDRAAYNEAEENSKHNLKYLHTVSLNQQ